MLVRKYEVYITDSRGVRLPEYSVVKGKRFAKCFIPSTAGQSFIIHVKDLKGVHDFQFTVDLDGRMAGAARCTPGAMVQRDGLRTVSPEWFQHFKFAKLKTTVKTNEDETVAVADLSELGTIDVMIDFIKPYPVLLPFIPHPPLQPIGPVDERMKKDGQHCAILGSPKRVRDPSACRAYETTLMNPNTDPWALFRFCYQPQEYLEAQGLTKEPTPAPALSRKQKRTRKRASKRALQLERRRAASAKENAPAAPEPKAGVQGSIDDAKVKVEPPRTPTRVKAEPVEDDAWKTLKRAAPPPTAKVSPMRKRVKLEPVD